MGIKNRGKEKTKDDAIKNSAVGLDKQKNKLGAADSTMDDTVTNHFARQYFLYHQISRRQNGANSN